MKITQERIKEIIREELQSILTEGKKARSLSDDVKSFKQEYAVKSGKLKELAQKVKRLTEKTEKMEVQGVLISKKLLNKDSNRVCSVCDVYSFDRRDDVYMSKFGCCNKCHIQWIEGREQRWTEGWRPKKENK